MSGLTDVVGLIAGSTPQGAMATVAAGAAEGLLSGLGTVAIKIREAIKGKELDPTIAAQLDAIAMQAEASALQGQLAVAVEEAKSSNVFIAGWRPFVGWVCGSALAYSTVLQPFLAFAVGVFKWQLPPLPVLDVASLTTILLALLGLGSMRTLEKVRGLTPGH